MFARHSSLRSAILIVLEWQSARRIDQSEGFAQSGSVPDYFAAHGKRLPAIVMRRSGVSCTDENRDL